MKKIISLLPIFGLFAVTVPSYASPHWYWCQATNTTHMHRYWYGSSHSLERAKDMALDLCDDASAHTVNHWWSFYDHTPGVCYITQCYPPPICTSWYLNSYPCSYLGIKCFCNVDYSLLK